MNGWQTAAAALCIISGTVYDANHHAVAAARVHLESADHKEWTAESDSAGVYRFSVPEGKYTLRTEDVAATVTANPNQATTVDLNTPPPFFDQSQYRPSAVTDYTYQGGHGSDAVFRSSEAMAKALEQERSTAGDSEENRLYAQGTELLNERRVQAATETFSKALAKYPQSVKLLLGMASSCYAQGSYDEAASWFFKATDAAPRDPKPYLFLAKVKASQITESKGFKERMARFAKLQPENALANYYYGLTLRDDQAAPVIQKAVALDPTLAPAYLSLGVVAERNKDYPAAIRDYQAAIAADPALEEAHFRLSGAYRLTGETEKAKQELTTFQRLSKAAASRQ
jgi:tetratricopeptide (TPR) repeat protein